MPKRSKAAKSRPRSGSWTDDRSAICLVILWLYILGKKWKKKTRTKKIDYVRSVRNLKNRWKPRTNLLHCLRIGSYKPHEKPGEFAILICGDRGYEVSKGRLIRWMFAHKRLVILAKNVHVFDMLCFSCTTCYCSRHEFSTMEDSTRDSKINQSIHLRERISSKNKHYKPSKPTKALTP